MKLQSELNCESKQTTSAFNGFGGQLETERAAAITSVLRMK